MPHKLISHTLEAIHTYVDIYVHTENQQLTVTFGTTTPVMSTATSSAVIVIYNVCG